MQSTKDLAVCQIEPQSLKALESYNVTGQTCLASSALPLVQLPRSVYHFNFSLDLYFDDLIFEVGLILENKIPSKISASTVIHAQTSVL